MKITWTARVLACSVPALLVVACASVPISEKDLSYLAILSVMDSDGKVWVQNGALIKAPNGRQEIVTAAHGLLKTKDKIKIDLAGRVFFAQKSKVVFDLVKDHAYIPVDGSLPGALNIAYGSRKEDSVFVAGFVFAPVDKASKFSALIDEQVYAFKLFKQELLLTELTPCAFEMYTEKNPASDPNISGSPVLLLIDSDLRLRTVVTHRLREKNGRHYYFSRLLEYNICK